MKRIKRELTTLRQPAYLGKVVHPTGDVADPATKQATPALSAISMHIHHRESPMRIHRADSTPSTPVEDVFTADERAMLREFYAGVRARRLRARYGFDPWEVIHRYRHLSADQYAAVSGLLGLAGARS